MLLTRDEMTFPFGEAKLDPQRDRDLLEWMFNQFLYGEITGIQVGHWLYDAPDFEAAKFLARQSLRRCSTSTTSCASWRCSAASRSRRTRRCASSRPA